MSEQNADSVRPAQMVLMLDTTARRPTFHAWGEHEFEKQPMLDARHEERHSRFATRCGLLLDEIRWVEKHDHKGYSQTIIEEHRGRWVGMRFDNASAIGKACGHCFRKAARIDGSGTPEAES